MTRTRERRDPLLESVTFTGGLVTRVTDDDTKTSWLDVAFPSTDGETRLFSDMLKDLEKQCLENGHYVEIRMVVDVRGGGFVVDSLIPGYGGSTAPPTE